MIAPTDHSHCVREWGGDERLVRPCCVESTFHSLPFGWFTQLSGIHVIILIFKMRKLRLREVNKLAPGHIQQMSAGAGNLTWV